MPQARSPFGGIPRNSKPESDNGFPRLGVDCSPFGGIPRNWKEELAAPQTGFREFPVPPSGGSLEIGKVLERRPQNAPVRSSPFGGIPRNWKQRSKAWQDLAWSLFPLRGDP